MRIIYAGIDLGVLETYSFNWEPVYDDAGIDYLYTKVSVVVRCMINGQAEVLNHIPGRPFNGPPMSYAFHDTVQEPPKAVSGELVSSVSQSPLPGQNAGGSNQNTPKFVPANILPPFTGGTVIAGGNILSKEEFKPAVKFPKSPPPLPADTLPPPAANRIIAPPIITRRLDKTAALQDMNVNPGSGVSGREKGTEMQLRDIIRVPNEASLTHIAIRHRLSIPRQRLYVFSGPGQESGKPKPGSRDRVEPPAQLLLESPQETIFQTDCKNGPIPKVLGIHAVMGDSNTFIVDWQCETYINEASLNKTPLHGALLSNRFSQTQVCRSDGYSMIGTAGTALFRTDLLTREPTNPDFDRPVLFMPIPQGFTREIEYVRGRPDVVGVDYAYTDTQVAVNFVAGVYVQAASISAVHRQAIVSGTDIFSGALNIYERVLDLMAKKHWAKGDQALRGNPTHLQHPVHVEPAGSNSAPQATTPRAGGRRGE